MRLPLVRWSMRFTRARAAVALLALCLALAGCSHGGAPGVGGCDASDTGCVLSTVRDDLQTLRYHADFSWNERIPEVDAVLNVLDPETRQRLANLAGGADAPLTQSPPGFTVAYDHPALTGLGSDLPPVPTLLDVDRLLDGTRSARRLASGGSGNQGLTVYRVDLDPGQVDEKLVLGTMRTFAPLDSAMRIRSALAMVWVDAAGEPMHVRLEVEAKGELTYDMTVDLRCSGFAQSYEPAG